MLAAYNYAINHRFLRVREYKCDDESHLKMSLITENAGNCLKASREFTRTHTY